MHPQKLMGQDIPGDQKVPVPVRDWQAMKLAIWRSKVAFEIVSRQADEILARCRHANGCPGAKAEDAPCTPPRFNENGDTVDPGCLDRELRMSALVILNAARQFAPIDARRMANEPYYAPSREYFSEVMSDLAAAQIELEAYRASGARVTPSPNGTALELPAPQTPQLEETT